MRYNAIFLQMEKWLWSPRSSLACRYIEWDPVNNPFFLNGFYPSIEFAVEVGSERINFLDITISIQEGEFVCDIFRKPIVYGCSLCPLPHKLVEYQFFINWFTASDARIAPFLLIKMDSGPPANFYLSWKHWWFSRSLTWSLIVLQQREARTISLISNQPIKSQ